MSVNTEVNRLRAILTIPLMTPSDLNTVSLRPFINPKIVDHLLFSMDDPFGIEEDKWTTGGLDPLTESNTPAENFNQALRSEIPAQLQDLILGNRYHYRCIPGGILIGLSQIAVTSFEFWRNPNSISPSFLILHLECNYGPSNKQALESFSNLNSKYLVTFLNNFFEIIHDTSMDVASLIERKSRKAMLILNFSSEKFQIVTQNGALIIESEDMDNFEPRLKSRFVFLSLLVGIQRYSIDNFKSEWPVLDELQRKEALELRSRINYFSNKWIWPRISNDDAFNLAYKKWQDSFSISEYLKNYKNELDEYLDLKILQSSDRIENILMSIAVLGIIPTWLGLFDKLNQRLIAGFISLGSFLIFIIWYRMRTDKNH